MRPPMRKPTARRKKSVNVSIDAGLAAEAKESGTNMSAVLERALLEELRESREQKWKAENKEANEAYNRFIRKNGLLSDSGRKF